MASIKELDEQINIIGGEIDFCHRGENGYIGGQEELDALIAEQNELIKTRDNLQNLKMGSNQ